MTTAPNLGQVFWITGLPGCGKSTLATAFADVLRSRGIYPVVLDGDAVRKVIGQSFSYSRSERLTMARVYADFAQLFARQNHTVIVATVSMLKEIYDYNRELGVPYWEIFLDVPLDKLRNLERKEIYANDPQSYGNELTPDFPSRPHLRLTATDISDRNQWLAEMTKFVFRTGKS